MKRWDLFTLRVVMFIKRTNAHTDGTVDALHLPFNLRLLHVGASLMKNIHRHITFVFTLVHSFGILQIYFNRGTMRFQIL